jgi:transposase
MLPQELGCGSGMTCWRRLCDWQKAGIWQLFHFVLLDWLARKGQIDWSLAVVDGSSIRAVFGGHRLVPTLSETSIVVIRPIRNLSHVAGVVIHIGYMFRTPRSVLPIHH